MGTDKDTSDVTMSPFEKPKNMLDDFMFALPKLEELELPELEEFELMDVEELELPPPVTFIEETSFNKRILNLEHLFDKVAAGMSEIEREKLTDAVERAIRAALKESVK